MKKVVSCFAIGCVVAIIGMLFSDICGDFFNGMDYGSACVLGMGLYLCVVIITCTGIIISKIRSSQAQTSNEQKTDL